MSLLKHRDLKINILSDKVPWFGKYSGYEGLPDYLPKSVNTSVYLTKNHLGNKIKGKIYKVLNNLSGRSEDIYNQKMFLDDVSKSFASHILYLENNITILKTLESADKKLIATVHLPISKWTPSALKLLATVKNIILLYKEDVEAFRQYTPHSTIHIIKHGVDINFYKPGSLNSIRRNKILFVGHFLRNFEMFYKVYDIISRDEQHNFEFHFIIPGEHRHPAILKKLMTHSNTFFHENLSDEELLSHYQDSYVLLMPLDDSGANTGIIQALATGLPVITTDVGGIRSYGGDEVFPLVANNDIGEMVELFYKYYNNENFRNEIAERQRNFAVEELDWRKIADEHVSFYKSVNSIPKVKIF